MLLLIVTLGVIRFLELSSTFLQKVAKMTMIAQLMFDLPAWWDYTNAEERSRIFNLFGRMRRIGPRGLLPYEAPAVADMVEEVNARLSAIQTK